MAERKTPNKGYQKLKSDLSAGNIGQVYIFYGEESYLREYYLGEIKKKLVPAGFEEFNYHRLSGKTLTMQELNEAVEAMPMMAERTLVVVTDCDLFKLPEEQRTALIALLNDFPPYCCLVFVYDLIEYKPSKTYKKLYEALDKNAQSVKFEAQERSDLINWIARRFRALGKGIDAQTAASAVAVVDRDAEYQRARALLERRVDAAMAHGVDTARRRLLGLLARRGYPGDLSRQVVHEVLAAYDAETDDGWS